MSPVATLFFQWGRCYSGFVTPLYGALLSVIVPSVQSPPSMLKLHDFCNRALVGVILSAIAAKIAITRYLRV